MKVFLVGDNRTNINWGSGASIALRQTISSSFEISGCITGDFFDLSIAEAGYVHTLMPPRYYRQFLHLLERRNRRIVRWYIRLEHLWGAHDFISEDPQTSVNSLIAEKHRYPALGRIHDEAVAADLFVLDGDGDIIFSTPPRRSTLFLLAMIELGLRLGKPVFLVNSMVSDCLITGRNRRTLGVARSLFSRCKAVALRDQQSLRYVQSEMPETNASFIPDSLFSWFPRYESEGARPPADGDFILSHSERSENWGKLDFAVPYICIGGGALASAYPDRAIESYCRLVDEVSKLGYRVYLAESDAPDSFLRRVATEKNVGIVPAGTPILMCGAVLACARLLISGRYHPSIFASLGGTPCIFLGSHAHKMGSLAELMEYEPIREFDAFPDDAEIDRIMTQARSYLEQGEGLRDRIRSVARRHADRANRLPEFLHQHLGSMSLQ